MIKDSSKLKRGQILRVDLNSVRDRLPKSIWLNLQNSPNGKLIGYKMVDGNQFGLVLALDIGISQWFFEEELSEIEEEHRPIT